MRRTLLCLAAIAALAGCASSHVPPQRAPHSSKGTCVPPGGGRCAGPVPITTVAIMQSADGRTLSGRFLCGGRLRVEESGETVRLTYVASAVRAGGMSCALPLLSVRLAKPLGHRTVKDGVSGQTVPVTRSR